MSRFVVALIILAMIQLIGVESIFAQGKSKYQWGEWIEISRVDSGGLIVVTEERSKALRRKEGLITDYRVSKYNECKDLVFQSKTRTVANCFRVKVKDVYQKRFKSKCEIF